MVGGWEIDLLNGEPVGVVVILHDFDGDGGDIKMVVDGVVKDHGIRK